MQLLDYFGNPYIKAHDVTWLSGCQIISESSPLVLKQNNRQHISTEAVLEETLFGGAKEVLGFQPHSML